MADGELYEGARYAVQNVGEVRGAPDVVSADIYRGTQALARSADRAVEAWSKAVEKGKMMKASLDMKQVAYDHDVELERRQNLPDGAAGSFFTPDGQLKREEIVKFLKPYQERIERAGGDLLDVNNQVEMAQQRGAMSIELGRQAELLGERLSRKKQEELCRDNFELSRRTGDYARAAAFARAGVEEGYWSAPKGKVMELMVGEEAIRERGGVRLRGSRGAGSDGVVRGCNGLLAQAEADGYEEPKDEEERTRDEVRSTKVAEPGSEGVGEAGVMGGADGGGGVGSDVGGGLKLDLGGGDGGVDVGGGLKLDFGGGDVGVDVGGGVKGLKLDLGGRVIGEVPGGADGGGVKLDLGEGDWVMGGDDSGLLRGMQSGQLTGLINEMVGEDTRLRKLQDEVTGDVRFTNTALQPKVVQRAAAYGNEHKEVTEEQYKTLAANVSLGAFAENPDETTERVMASFEGSGMYEAMGGGDEEAGKLRVRAMVDEVKGRMNMTRGLSMARIEKMAEARADELGADSRGEAQVVGNMATGGWEAWKSEEEIAGLKGEEQREVRGRQEKLQREETIFWKYAGEYKPELTKPRDMGERWKVYKDNAEGFKAWYLKGKRASRLREERDARAEWYKARIVEKLRANLQVGKDGKVGYGGYANEVAVAREVLAKERPPAELGVKEREAEAERVRAADARLSESFRLRAASAHEGLKKARDAREAEEAAAKAEAKAAAERKKAEEKAAAERVKWERARLLHTERDGEWYLDKSAPSGVGARPTCTISQRDYDELVRRGALDGTKVLYVRIGTRKILVTGVNKKGTMMLSVPAAEAIQKKPNARRGERWQCTGKMRYSYVLGEQ